MFPHTFLSSGVPNEVSSGLEMTAEFAPLLMGMVVVLGLCILGMALDAWVYYAWAQPKTEVEKAGAKVEVLYRKRFFCPGKGREVTVDFLAYRGEPDRANA